MQNILIQRFNHCRKWLTIIEDMYREFFILGRGLGPVVRLIQNLPAFLSLAWPPSGDIVILDYDDRTTTPTTTTTATDNVGAIMEMAVKRILDERVIKIDFALWTKLAN